MAPKPENLPLSEERSPDTSGQRVVISGMSGLYPESHSVMDLSNILYNKINPVNNENRRWQYDHPEVSQYTGKVPELNLFDAQFFKVYYRLSHNMEPMSRKLLEKAYEAIFDAGICPDELSGKNVGVFIGNGNSESEKAIFDVNLSKSGVGLAGCCRAMYANRISYWLNAKGPSITVDELCCSSTKALEQGYLAIKRGECDAAIVGGSSLCLHPQAILHYGRITKMSMDGKTKSFDTEAAGCARSEAINILFLQKAENALRIYADVVHVKSNFISIPRGKTGPMYGFYRDPENMANFIRNFYEEAQISPDVVEYVEAFGSAVPEADKAELEAIEKVYCNNRSKPLLVGSVTSNIGYTEGASGISAITKVLLGYHYRKLAGNLNCESPRTDVDALRDGRMRIINDHQTFEGNYAAVNSISVTGVNSHVLLHGHYKPKDIMRYKANFPQLLTVSARQESAVEKLILDLKIRPVDPEQLALLRNIHKKRILGHLGRGFVLLDTNEKNETICLQEKVKYFDDAKRPLWFIYSGMGSQWVGMGAQLMRIPVFAAAIERCQRVLKPKGVDIVHIITSPDKTTFDNILNSFVGIAAIQIGLTDVLRELKIFPDMIMGHSVGELGCAYADGCFTAEEMILSAYSRGLVSVQTPFIRGSMAAIGIGYQQISKMCPPEIEVACHNSPNSSTISGPADIMKEFVAKLTSKGIFAKEVPCSNIAYHSRYIAGAGPGLLKYLSEVITTPKERSKRWISTSVPEEKWNDPIAKYSSAEYHTNNLLNPVLFEESLGRIPSNAVVVEIAPHGLLQAILKRSLPESCTHVPLTRRGHTDNTQLLLEAVGILYTEGYNPDVQALYPKIEFPVSTGTPMLSHLVEWAHTEDWNVLYYAEASRKSAAQCTHVISILDDDHRYLKGHVIREQCTYPFAATLVAVWDTLAMILGVSKKQFTVEFCDVYLHSQPELHERKLLRLNVAIHRGNGRFEVLDDKIKVAQGFVKGHLDRGILEEIKEEVKSEEVMELLSNDIYHLMHSRDYNYSNEFRSIYNANTSLNKANLLWQDNWVTLIDGMIQLNALRRNHESVSQPNFIRRIKIDVDDHLRNKTSMENAVLIPASIYELTDSTRCGGVLIEQLKFYDLPLMNEEQIALKTLKFVPHSSSNLIDEISAIHVFLQILAENLNRQNINVLEVIEYQGQKKFTYIQKVIHDVPEIKVNFSQICRNDLTKKTDVIEDIDVLMITNLAVDDNMCQVLHRILKRDTFLINREDCSDMTTTRPALLYRSVCVHIVGPSRLELNIWQPSDVTVGTSAVTVFSQDDLSKLNAQISSLPSRYKLLILTSRPPLPGLKDLIKEQITKNNRKIRLLINSHKIFDDQCLNRIQFTDLATNILDNGIWGGEYYLPIQEKGNVGRDMTLETTRLGDIDSLQWTEAVTESSHPGFLVKVQYVGLNERYVKKILELAVSENKTESKLIEYDFSGTMNSKVRVMGITQEKSISTSVKAKPELLWPVPDHWTLEDAATVPLAYCLAFYCLCFRSRLYHGNSILVHGGAGALGQAVISIALAHGCNIYTTVSNIKKKQFLLKLFPELKEDQIGNSRDNTFKDMVFRGTKGKGCHIVISCVSGELRSGSIFCSSSFGFVVDTSLLLDKEYNFGMNCLNRAVSYSTQQFSTMFEPQNAKDLQRLQLMVSEGIARGYVRPLSRVVYAAGDVARALRLQAGSKHAGRVLLHVQENIIPSTHTTMNCSAHRLQLLLLDNESLGMQLVDRLISRGARKFILYCSNKSNSILFKLRSWQKQGIQCTVSYGKAWNEHVFDNICIEEVEGIYCVLNSKTHSENILSSLEKLDATIRSSNSTLKYFAVIHASKEVSETIKLKISHKVFTSIKLPPLKKELVESNFDFEKYISINNAVEAIEKALCYKQRAIEVHCTNKPNGNILQALANRADITIPHDVSQEATLKDLGMNLAQAQIVRACLYDHCNILLDESTIPFLKIKELRDIEKGILKSGFFEAKELKTFFSYIEQDAMQATTDIVFLPTLTTSDDLRGDEYYIGQSFLCILPGVEGLHIRFRELSERLKLQALVLQPGLERPHETIQETAQRYVNTLLKKTQMKNRFYLLGYESGVMVALEMAAILEDQGFTGTIFCIGGAPKEVQATFEEELGHLDTEESLQIAVTRHLFTLLINDDKLGDIEYILKSNTVWKEKVSLCVHKLLGRFNHSTQYAQEFIEAAYARIIQARRYNSEPRPLRSLLISIRPRYFASKPSNSFSLQSHSQQKVIEYDLEAPLAFAAQDLQCAAIVNRHLDTELLAEFENTNLCETYIMNLDSFINVDDYKTK